MSSDGMHTEILRATPARERTPQLAEVEATAEAAEASDAHESEAHASSADASGEATTPGAHLATVPSPSRAVAATTTTATMTLREAGAALMTQEAEQRFLAHWKEIQVAFVDDPLRSVEDADTLLGEIAAAWQRAIHERRQDLAADWERGEPDTEELRTALLRYRTFIGILLPK